MLATHHPKFQDSTLRVTAIQKLVDFDTPHNLLCSNTVAMRQILWACPNSAADIRKWREESASAIPVVLNKTFEFTEIFPTTFDPHMKSLLIPMDTNIADHKDITSLEYIATTPVQSLGVVHEIFKRPLETGTSTHLAQHVLQPNVMAMSNHGETLLMQSGKYRSFQQHIPSNKYLSEDDFEYIQDHLDDSFIMFSATLQSMNINSGLIAEGLPSLTAIGGFVHMLERETLQDLDFAIGIKSVHINQGKQRYVDQSQKNKSKLAKGVLANVRATLAEITGSVELVLLLKPKAINTKKINKMISILENKNLRIAGGTVCNPNVIYKKLKCYDFIGIKWLYDHRKFQNEIDQYFTENPIVTVHQKKDDQISTFERESDLLDCALHLHHKYEHGMSYSINHTGYLFLETAKERYGLRTNGYDHAFSEPLFGLVQLSNSIDFDHLFWTRKKDEHSVYWQTNSN